VLGVAKALEQNQDEPSEEFSDSDEAESGVDAVVVELEDGQKVYVTPHTWEMYKFSLDSKTKTIQSQSTGSFTQYPFKLAWAVTIHKAQGKTFEKVYVEKQSWLQKILESIFQNSAGLWLEKTLGNMQLARIKQEKYIFVKTDELSFHPGSKHEALLKGLFEV
jgi:hypothetical protein